MMIKLYTGSGCSSSRRAKRWLIVHDIPFIEQNLIRQPLTKNEFIHLLKLTNNGVTEMLSTHSISYKNLVHRIDELSLSELYIEIRTSPSLLKKPIIYDQSAKLLTGFSEDKIRMFLSKAKRKQELNELLLSGHLVDFKENNLLQCLNFGINNLLFLINEIQFFQYGSIFLIPDFYDFSFQTRPIIFCRLSIPVKYLCIRLIICLFVDRIIANDNIR